MGLKTSRAEIYRAALLSLSGKTRKNLELLERIGRFKAESLIISGGGSKNQLWNQIRANILGIPLRRVRVYETTVLGAALFAYKGTGFFSSIEEGQQVFSVQYDWLYPDLDFEI